MLQVRGACQLKDAGDDGTYTAHGAALLQTMAQLADATRENRIRCSERPICMLGT